MDCFHLCVLYTASTVVPFWMVSTDESVCTAYTDVSFWTVSTDVSLCTVSTDVSL